MPMDKEMEKPFRAYVEVFRQGLALQHVTYKKPKKPKVSIVIPMYNEAKNAKSVIRSIQKSIYAGL